MRKRDLLKIPFIAILLTFVLCAGVSSLMRVHDRSYADDVDVDAPIFIDDNDIPL